MNDLRFPISIQSAVHLQIIIFRKLLGALITKEIFLESIQSLVYLQFNMTSGNDHKQNVIHHVHLNLLLVENDFGYWSQEMLIINIEYSTDAPSTHYKYNCLEVSH